ncbi:DUF4271 domain-containing protein [Geofilum sp. OHC36d9]|uniref:DUF4271 domain-containing protein n=1 Tax=Geofilum sp. OHC36d9 TaxID=3458413 RepID=UPI0040339974
MGVNYQTISTDSLSKAQTLPVVQPVQAIIAPGDSTHQISVARSPIHLIQIDSIRMSRRNIPATTQHSPVKKITKPAISNQDSILFNLKGAAQQKVNWSMIFESYDNFNDTINTQIHPIFISNKNNENKTQNIKKAVVPPKTTVEQKKYRTEIKETETIVKEPLHNDWFFGLLVLSVVLLGWIRLRSSRYITDLMHAILYPDFTGKLSRNNISNSQPSFLLYLLFYFNSSVLIYEITTRLNQPFLGLQGALILPVAFVFLFTIMTMKALVYRLSGKIFNTSDAVNAYLAQSSAMSKAFAIFLTPFILLIPFTEGITLNVLIKTALTLFIFLYLIQTIRGIRNNLVSLLSGYYIILYLCALEIVPLSLLYKVLFK